jgi:hypothetical protein
LIDIDVLGLNPLILFILISFFETNWNILNTFFQIN